MSKQTVFRQRTIDNLEQNAEERLKLLEDLSNDHDVDLLIKFHYLHADLRTLTKLVQKIQLEVLALKTATHISKKTEEDYTCIIFN